MRAPKVITVGWEPSEPLAPVVAALVEQGFAHLSAPSPEGVAEYLLNGDRMVVLVYDGGGENLAHRLLTAMGGRFDRVPVIVVVSEPKIDEFYDLMCEGAYDYFGLADGYEAIIEAARWAAGTAAVSPRALFFEGSQPDCEKTAANVA
jgi:DNA-binding NtrC family response regulator